MFTQRLARPRPPILRNSVESRLFPTIPTASGYPPPLSILPTRKPLTEFTSCNRHVTIRFIGSYSCLGSDRRMDSKATHPPQTEALDASVDDSSPSVNSQGSDESVISVEEEREGGDQPPAVLPEVLSRTMMKLECESSAEGGVCDIYLVGTGHVSTESCREVQAVISFLKPQVVFLELCSSRMAILNHQNFKVPSIGEMMDMYKNKQNIFGILYSWFLAKVANKLEVLPGSEFRVAYEEAMKYGGKVILGDRPVQITLGRTWEKMPLWHKTKLLYSLLFQAFFLPSSEDLNRMLKVMDDVDMFTLVIQEMSKEFPTLMETLVHERDQYMSSTLLQVAGEHSSVVAVVGKGHLQGIRNHWKQPVEYTSCFKPR